MCINDSTINIFVSVYSTYYTHISRAPNFMWSQISTLVLRCPRMDATAVSIRQQGVSGCGCGMWDVGPANIPHSPASSGHRNSCLIGWLAGQLVITWWPPEVNKTGSFPRRLAPTLLGFALV